MTGEFYYWHQLLNFVLRKYEVLAVGKRRSQLESHVTEESASHPTLAFEVEVQSATSEIAVVAGQIENAMEFNYAVNFRLRCI